MANGSENQNIIDALKNPEVREKMNEILNNPAGKSFSEMTETELSEIHGASDVKPETTPYCVGIIVGLTTSIKICK